MALRVTGIFSNVLTVDFVWDLKSAEDIATSFIWDM